MKSMDPEHDGRVQKKAATAAADPHTLDMFAPVAHARRTDPSSSARAAQEVTDNGKLRTKQAAVLDVFMRFGAFTDEALVDLYEALVKQEPDTHPAQSQSGIRTRRSELSRMGYLMSDMEGRTKLNKPALIWRIKHPQPTQTL